jgi:hypothetical protein
MRPSLVGYRSFSASVLSPCRRGDRKSRQEKPNRQNNLEAHALLPPSHFESQQRVAIKKPNT